jgi:hypothetical protein
MIKRDSLCSTACTGLSSSVSSILSDQCVTPRSEIGAKFQISEGPNLDLDARFRTLDGLKGMTTVMIRNIPCKYKQEFVMDEVSAVAPEYNFLYMPPARRDGGSKGYAFVNFCNEEAAHGFIKDFQGHMFYRQPNSLKRADVGYAEIQGLLKNVKFYKKCKVFKSNFQPFVDRAAMRAHGRRNAIRRKSC